MGGTSGEIRGKTKIEVYSKYIEIINLDIFSACIPDPKNKKYCKKSMIWDPKNEEWVLFYRLHT